MTMKCLVSSFVRVYYVCALRTLFHVQDESADDRGACCQGERSSIHWFQSQCIPCDISKEMGVRYKRYQEIIYIESSRCSNLNHLDPDLSVVTTPEGGSTNQMILWDRNEAGTLPKTRFLLYLRMRVRPPL